MAAGRLELCAPRIRLDGTLDAQDLAAYATRSGLEVGRRAELEVSGSAHLAAHGDVLLRSRELATVAGTLVIEAARRAGHVGTPSGDDGGDDDDGDDEGGEGEGEGEGGAGPGGRIRVTGAGLAVGGDLHAEAIAVDLGRATSVRVGGETRIFAGERFLLAEDAVLAQLVAGEPARLTALGGARPSLVYVMAEDQETRAQVKAGGTLVGCVLATTGRVEVEGGLGDLEAGYVRPGVYGALVGARVSLEDAVVRQDFAFAGPGTLRGIVFGAEDEVNLAGVDGVRLRALTPEGTETVSVSHGDFELPGVRSFEPVVVTADGLAQGYARLSMLTRVDPGVATEADRYFVLPRIEAGSFAPLDLDPDPGRKGWTCERMSPPCEVPSRSSSHPPG